MKFKGTIIITDPCYIVKKYNEWEDTHDDWTKCMYGRNMEALGIEHYFTESTLYGDWGCTTYKIKENPYTVINKFAESENTDEDYGISYSILGEFCADAGLVSVLLLDEVRKYNPDIDEWIASHDWCVTTIPDFDGEVNYYVDANDCAHIIGIGNINFFTTQTSL